MAAAVPSTKKKLLSNFMRRKEQGTRVPRKSPTTREGMFLSQGVSVENFREVRRCFAAKAGDVFVASYPKSGTTWMQHIVSLIKNNGVDDGEDLDDKWLWIEQFSLAEVEVCINLLLIWYNSSSQGASSAAIFSSWCRIVQNSSSLLTTSWTLRGQSCQVHLCLPQPKGCGSVLLSPHSGHGRTDTLGQVCGEFHDRRRVYSPWTNI